MHRHKSKLRSQTNRSVVKLSQKPKQKLHFLGQMVIISFNPPTHKYEGDRIEKNLVVDPKKDFWPWPNLKNSQSGFKNFQLFLFVF